MNVILYAADNNWLAIQVGQSPTEVTVQFFTHCMIAQKRSPVFSGENRVNQNLREGLWHGCRMRKPRAGFNPFRVDDVLWPQPRVARSSQPWAERLQSLWDCCGVASLSLNVPTSPACGFTPSRKARCPSPKTRGTFSSIPFFSASFSLNSKPKKQFRFRGLAISSCTTTVFR